MAQPAPQPAQPQPARAGRGAGNRSRGGARARRTGTAGHRTGRSSDRARSRSRLLPAPAPAERTRRRRKRVRAITPVNMFLEASIVVQVVMAHAGALVRRHVGDHDLEALVLLRTERRDAIASCKPSAMPVRCRMRPKAQAEASATTRSRKCFSPPPTKSAPARRTTSRPASPSAWASSKPKWAKTLSSGMGMFATVGSIAAFVGLFGTVWGIMNSFIGIAETQTTNLAVVAPGIAEALFATAHRSVRGRSGGYFLQHVCPPDRCVPNADGQLRQRSARPRFSRPRVGANGWKCRRQYVSRQAIRRQQSDQRDALRGRHVGAVDHLHGGRTACQREREGGIAAVASPARPR